MHSTTEMIDRLIASTPDYDLDRFLEDKGVTISSTFRLLTTTEVCELLRISRMTLHRLRADLQPVRIGARTLFDPGDVNRLIEARKHNRRPRLANEGRI